MATIDALIIPRERPPDLLELKKALLTFDRVFLFEAEDREVIPPHALMLAISGGFMPVAMQMHPVMPLGKAPGFDQEFEQVRAAIEYGKAEGVVETLIPPPDLSGQMILGSIPLGPDTPNPTFVLTILRHLATDQAFLDDAVSTAFPLAGLGSSDLEALAPSGAGHHEISTMPAPVTYSGPVPSEELREVVTRVARARLGSVVRSLATANNKQLQPLADDAGIAAIVRRLSERLRTVEAHLPAAEEEHLVAERLGRLHQIMLQETFVAEDLSRMSMDDILRLRSRAWGRSQEHRQRLLVDLRQIALEERSAEDFEARCRRELDAYRDARAQLQNDWANLRIKVECTIGAAITSQGSGVVQKMLGTGSLETLLVIGAVLFPLAGNFLPDIRNLVRAERLLMASTGYGLATPYKGLVR